MKIKRKKVKNEKCKMKQDTSINNYIIKTIDLEKYKQDNEFYTVNLYTDRKFDSEVHVLLYKNESFGNYHYFQYFKMMDELNIKVIVYCIFTLFPLASVIGHEVRMHKVDGNIWFNGLTRYGFDRKKAWFVYDIPNSRNKYWDVPNILKTDLKHLKSWEVRTLVEEAYKRPMYIDSNAYNIFTQNNFPKKCIIAEIKTKWYKQLVSQIEDLNLDYVLGTDKQIQKKIVREFNGSDYLLTYQILMSVFNQVEYLGVAGAASLFSAVPTINAMFISDNRFEDNVEDNSIIFKALLNNSIFDKETIGFFHSRRNLKSYRLENSWMWDSLKMMLTTWSPSNKTHSIRVIQS